MKDKQERSIAPQTAAKPRVGISSCLLGEKVRFDGGNKWHRIIVQIIGPQVEWVPVCPEVEVGMGTPRERVNLVGLPESPAMLATGTGKNWSEEMNTFSRHKIQTMKTLQLDGFIFKKSSPSCGLKNVKVFKDSSLVQWVPFGIGLYARQFLLEFPDLPVADEGELSTKQEAFGFLEKVKRHHRLYPEGLGED